MKMASNQRIFHQDMDAVQYLMASDARLAALIKEIGDYALVLREDYFASLARAIIGQQLSVKAAETIWKRTVHLCGGRVGPEVLTELAEEQLRGAGLSKAKVSYLRDLQQKILGGELCLREICQLPDEEVVAALTRVKGIGRWTAEMFLIFSLGRLNVWAVDDVGLRRAVKWLYRLAETPAGNEMKSYGTRWSPYSSMASLYLWEAINRGLVK